MEEVGTQPCFEWDDAVRVHGLESRPDLNNRAARVCKLAPRPKDGRIGIQFLIGAESVWVKPSNLTIIPDERALADQPFCTMPEADLLDLRMFFCANEGSEKLPGLPARMMSALTLQEREHERDFIGKAKGL
jgi:hypothetical protein